MKKYYFLIVVALILGMVLTGCLLSNVGQVPSSEQSGITYLTKGSYTGLVGLWSFDEGGDSTTANDSSGNDNHGEIYGANYFPDQWGGQALNFDGLTHYVDAGSDTSFDFAGKFTVEAWINGETFQSTYYDLVVFRGYNKWAFGVDRAKRLMFGEAAWNAYFSRQIYSDALSWTTGQWYHIAVVYDTVEKTADFYRDGVPVGVGNQSTDKLGITNSGDVTIGYPHSVSFNGTIDEVRIYDYALSPDMIADHAAGIYGFNGLLAPYVAPPKAFKAGRSIPLKWQYTDSFGVEVESSAADPSVKVMFKDTTEEFPEETIIVEDTGESGYRYHSDTKTWQFNWQTKGCASGRYEIWITSMQTGQINGPILIDLK